ncbi:MAG TPA: hypothetical protein VMU75_03920 [Acidimicrobiales bacterium]|nr:hypothetical protein [Acidimicrobiales bacterium]
MTERPSPTAFELVGLGATAAGCIAVGVGGGYWLGSATGAGSAAELGGLAIGLVAAVAATYFKIKRYL